MPSIGHIAVGMAVARWRHPEARSLRELARPMLGWSALSILPDADVLTWQIDLDVPGWDHRGATHSLAFCLAVALVAAAVARWRKRNASARFRWTLGVLLTHPLLDMMTIHGLGCMLLWPLTERRFMLPFRFVPPSPFGARFLSLAGAQTASMETFLFLPLFLYAVWPRRR